MLIPTTPSNAVVFFRESHELAQLHGAYIKVNAFHRSQYERIAVLP
jgi:phosphopantothenate synthetase